MISGTIINILTQKENDWGRYIVETAGKEYLTVGIIPGASVGMDVVLEGDEEINQYGKQYKISSVLSSQADNNAGIRRFLSDGYIKGLGAEKANKIVAKFGSSAIELFEDSKKAEQLLEVKGIGKSILSKILESYEENKKYKDIVLFLAGTGTKAQVEKIYEKYGDNAASVLKTNPYILQLEIDGFGFKKTDALAVASGIKLDSKERMMAGIKYVLEEAASMKGHCYLTIDEVRTELLSLLVPVKETYDNKNISKKVVENHLADWANKREDFIEKKEPSADTLKEIDNIAETRRIINNTLNDVIDSAIKDEIIVCEGDNVYVKKLYETECAVAQLINEILDKKPVRIISPEKIEIAIKDVELRKTQELNDAGNHGCFVATDEQKNAVYTALSNRLAIVSGGPGRGKTAISEMIAHGFLSAGDRYDEEDIIMLAPTGRAAQRMTESTGYNATTIHRAILSRRRGEDLPENKLIIIDEFSMADINLAKGVLEYGKNCNIVIVGDVDQIASVGPGKVLKDFIDSNKIPCVLLVEGHRNTGTIAKNSNLINAGLKLNSYCYDEHFVYIPATKLSIASILVEDYKKMVEKYGIKNVMLCTAMKERGEVAVNKLNKLLQDIFTKGNKQALFSDNKVFREGDRVIQTKNDYNFVMMRNKEQSLGVFNGERGTVTKVIYDQEFNEYKLVVLFDDGSIGGYTSATVANLSLAYATTLHKCQGSEAACMMMAYTFGDYMLLNRSLFYTGETRAKKEFRFYGEEKYQYGKVYSAFDLAVSKVDDHNRNTCLSSRIAG